MADNEPGSQLKLYVHLGSSPARAVVIFCRASNIEAQEISVDVIGQENRKPEYKKLNPMGMIPCIDDGGFLLHESHAILRYLATTRNVADHWYPKDPKRQALLDAALDWHHTNLRRYSCQLFQNRTLVKIPEFAGVWPPANHDALAAAAFERLPRVFDELESMLQESKFLQHADQVSIADLSLACELLNLQVLCSVEDNEKLLGGRERISKWMADVEQALQPYISDSEQHIRAFGKHLGELRANGADL